MGVIETESGFLVPGAVHDGEMIELDAGDLLVVADAVIGATGTKGRDRVAAAGSLDPHFRLGLLGIDHALDVEPTILGVVADLLNDAVLDIHPVLAGHPDVADRDGIADRRLDAGIDRFLLEKLDPTALVAIRDDARLDELAVERLGVGRDVEPLKVPLAQHVVLVGDEGKVHGRSGILRIGRAVQRQL